MTCAPVHTAAASTRLLGAPVLVICSHLSIRGSNSAPVRWSWLVLARPPQMNITSPSHAVDAPLRSAMAFSVAILIQVGPHRDPAGPSSQPRPPMQSLPQTPQLGARVRSTHAPPQHDVSAQ